MLLDMNGKPPAKASGIDSIVRKKNFSVPAATGFQGGGRRRSGTIPAGRSEAIDPREIAG
jgi:hypothetical protein